jgi:hypothetical protein
MFRVTPVPEDQGARGRRVSFSPGTFLESAVFWYRYFSILCQNLVLFYTGTLSEYCNFFTLPVFGTGSFFGRCQILVIFWTVRL